MNDRFVFKIEVMLFPGNEYDPNRPYFWCLFSSERNNDDSDWRNSGAGWSATPEGAWKDAYSYYERHYKNE